MSAAPAKSTSVSKSSERVVKFADMFSAMGTEPRLRIMQLLLTAHPEGLVVNEIQIVKVEIDGGPCGPSAWEAEMSCRTYRDLAYEKEDADWRLGQYAPGIREIDLWIVRSAFLRTVMEAHRIDCPICQGK